MDALKYASWYCFNTDFDDFKKDIFPEEMFVDDYVLKKFTLLRTNFAEFYLSLDQYRQSKFYDVIQQRYSGM